jgi:hypothetical protein
MKVWVVAGLVAASAVAGGATARAADGTLVRRLVDQTTGSDVRVYRGAGQDISVEVSSRDVTVRKVLTEGTVRTTIETRGERWALVVGPSGLALETPAGVVRAATASSAAFARARESMARSSAVRRAIALLGKVNLGPRSPEGHLFLTTRSVLLALGRDTSGRVELARWIEEARQPRFVRVGQDRTPTECWDAYVKEAIAAVDEYRDCLKGVGFFDIFGNDACELIYDLRAIAAFSWWIRCVTFA